MAEDTRFSAWTRSEYATRFPAPARNRTDPRTRLREHPSLTWVHSESFDFEVEFSARELRDYLTTQSNVEMAISSGTTLDDVDRWLDSALARFFEGVDRRTFAYRGRADCAAAL